MRRRRATAALALIAALVATSCTSDPEPETQAGPGHPQPTLTPSSGIGREKPEMPQHAGLEFTRPDGSTFGSRVFRRVICGPMRDDGVRWVSTLSRLPHNTYLDVAVPVRWVDGVATYVPGAKLPGGFRTGAGAQVSVTDPWAGPWREWRSDGRLDGRFTLVAAGCGKAAALAFTIDVELPGYVDPLEEAAVPPEPVRVSGAVSAPFHYRDR